MPDLQRLAALARALLPPGTAVAATDPRVNHRLLPGEALPGAVPARLAEFSAGRAAARMALAELGLPAIAVPHGADRAPVWPPGVAGTITHSATACLAAVSRSARGLGLDLEPDAPLDPALWDTVLLPAEAAFVAEGPDAGRNAMLVFSAKEAVYKAQYPLTRLLFGFDRLALTPLPPQAFAARFTVDTAHFHAGDTVLVRHARAEGHILTAAAF